MMKNLFTALSYFDGNSGLDNFQVKEYLKKAFLEKRLIKKEILLELCSALNDKNFEWKSFVKHFNWFYNLDEMTEGDICNYVIDLICDQILTVEITTD
ncbi:MAG: hypothetical protein IPH57_18745 [Saprospiraceae bacterium]|nr:hypothetical protein [Saprospiraceae bacterium]